MYFQMKVNESGRCHNLVPEKFLLMKKLKVKESLVKKKRKEKKRKKQAQRREKEYHSVTKRKIRRESDWYWQNSMLVSRFEQRSPCQTLICQT